MDNVRVRFAPSPTGQIHIGNIRSAIFSWLFGRHHGGVCLLRIEDTDRERSTPEATRQLLADLQWLDLPFDGEPLYQSSQIHKHIATAETLVAKGHAYRHAKGEGGGDEAILFRIPWDTDGIANVRSVGEIELSVHPETPVTVAAHGVSFAQTSKKGKPAPAGACLAGFLGLRIFDRNDVCIFDIATAIDDPLRGDRTCTVEGGCRMSFIRREVVVHDLIKGELAKPLDSMKDFVILRGDRTPVFHLANVSDDITQQITHIIRGDDHVENTYRHLFLYHALQAKPPHFAHLPMIINEQGKPYSKRDGDAYVGELRDHGYLPDAVFNYLALLGWSPGDNREKMGREEIIHDFSLERVQRSPAQMDMKKLLHLNGLYISEMDRQQFIDRAGEIVRGEAWGRHVDEEALTVVATLMQSRTKLFSNVKEWQYFFSDDLVYDPQAVAKNLCQPGMGNAFARLISLIEGAEFTVAGIEAAIQRTTDELGIKEGKLNLPIRIAVTATATGAGIYEIIHLLGRERVLKRLRHAIEHLILAQ